MMRQPVHAKGDLFPDFTKLKGNKKEKGRVCSVHLETQKDGTSHPVVEFDAEAWEAFRQHPRFDEDYRLSMAKLFVQVAAKLYT